MDTVINQQDGATSHCSYDSLEYLCRYFHEDSHVTRHTDHPRPVACIFSSPIPFVLVSAGISKRQSMLTIPKQLIRSTITFDRRFREFPIR